MFVADLIVVAIAFTVQFMPIPYLRPDIPVGKLVGETSHFTPMLTFILLIATIPPSILSVLTYWQVVVPLKNGNVPSRSWNLVLSVLGYVFGLFVGGVLLSMAYFDMNSRNG